MIDTSTRTAFGEDHEAFRGVVRRFIDKEVVPNLDRWEAAGIVEREFWLKCGAAGLLCPTVPEAFGGPGLNYLFNAVLQEELAYSGCNLALSLHSDVVAEYLVSYGTEEQKRHWLPRMVSGEVVTAIAMTEPSAGSDLQGIRTTARREGDHYVIRGSKTYITNGQSADLVIVVAKTDPEAGARGISLLLVEASTPGFRRGRMLDKIGLHSCDTAELFFDDVRVPVTNLLGEENRGFAQMMTQLPRERLTVAVTAHGCSQRAFDEAVKYTRERKAFGKSVSEFQNTRFVLAGLKAKLQVASAHLDWALKRHVEGRLTTAEACATKLWHTEVQWEICDAALQLHGGAGYMNEYLIARLWRDARVQRIYGGTSEIMKEVIARSI